MTVPDGTKDVLLLIGRFVIGFDLIMHGLQKVSNVGGTQKGFAAMGVPLPELSALLAMGIELVGGALLIVGAFTAVAGLVAAAFLVMAALFAHLGSGWLVSEGGPSYVLALAAGCVLIAAAGPGAYSVQRLMSSRQRQVASVEAS